MTSVVWFKRDLRVIDHQPLFEAAALGPAVGLYIYEPIIYQAQEHDTRHLRFINQSLEELRNSLRALGTELILRRGNAIKVLAKLHLEMPFGHLFAHEETGLQATYDRDLQVAAWCKQNHIRFIEHPQHGVVRRLPTRDGWAKRWLTRMSPDPLPIPTSISQPSASLDPGEIASHTEFELPPSTATQAQVGGESHAQNLLHTFLFERGKDYTRAMSSPSEATDACSRLSAHIALGTISVRTCHHAALARKQELNEDPSPDTKPWRSAVASFEKRLRWHCHFIQKLEDEPGIEYHNINRAFDHIREEDETRWTHEQQERFHAFKTGTTGYPIVDACMRCLDTTGWINFRMRAMLVSFASYHLWLHWRPTARVLARLFTDFEPGIHYPQVQMQSGVTGINTVRIYSPIKQTIDQDPAGEFIRRWIPELGNIPNEYLAQPGAMPTLTQHLARCTIDADYPSPIVEHKAAYNQAKQLIFDARATVLAKAESRRVYKKHGSRKSPENRTLTHHEDRNT